VVIEAVDQGSSEGHDFGEEHPVSDAESPAGTVVSHERGIDAAYADALIPVSLPTAYHRRKPARHVKDSTDASGTSSTALQRRRIAEGGEGTLSRIP
jgi:hypothetical protein